MSTLDFLFNGFAIAFQWQNILFAFVGVLIGTAVGVLPGIGPMSGVALLIPVTATLTSGMPTEAAAASSIILLAGVYYGAMYGGSTTSILLNTPGESSSVVTTIRWLSNGETRTCRLCTIHCCNRLFCCGDCFVNRFGFISRTPIKCSFKIWSR